MLVSLPISPDTLRPLGRTRSCEIPSPMLHASNQKVFDRYPAQSKVHSCRSANYEALIFLTLY